MIEKLLMLWVFVTAIFSTLTWAKEYTKDCAKGVSYPSMVYFLGAIVYWLVLGIVPYWILH